MSEKNVLKLPGVISEEQLTPMTGRPASIVNTNTYAGHSEATDTGNIISGFFSSLSAHVMLLVYS